MDVGVGVVGGAVTLQQSGLLQSVEHSDAALLTDATVDAALAAASRVSSVAWLSVSVLVEVLSLFGSHDCCSLSSTPMQLVSLMPLSTL